MQAMGLKFKILFGRCVRTVQTIQTVHSDGGYRLDYPFGQSEDRSNTTTTRGVLESVFCFRSILDSMFDVQSQFQSGDLASERRPDGEITACILLKVLYGLKQAGRVWYFTLVEFLKSLGFKICLSDPAVFFRQNKSGDLHFVGLHVDDPVQKATRLEDCLEVERKISEHFQFKSQGEICRFLGCMDV